MASLKTIAAELNISISLVSKVLNNRMGTSNVSPATADAIRKKAKELKYKKNESAVSLQQGRHDTIGIFLHRHGEAGSGLLERMMIGIAEGAEGKNLKLMVFFFDTTEKFIELSKNAHLGVIDGLIMGGRAHHELADRILEIKRDGLPVVTIQNSPLHEDIPNVGVSQQAIAHLATQHLIDQGCKKMGHIRGRETRYEGFCAALHEAHLPLESARIIPSGELGYSLAAGEQFAREILDQQIELDGLVAESDQQALGAINVFQAAGIRVPEQIKVIGVDDAPFCEYVPTTLSSISQRISDKGHAALNTLLKLRNGEPAGSITLEPELKIRRSSGGA